MKSKINMDAVYRQTVAMYKQAGAEDDKLQLIGKSNLIMTAAITAGMTNASFNINSNTGSTQQTWEIRLSTTDSFTCTRLGIRAYGIIGTSTGPAGTTSYKWWTYAPWQLQKAFVAINPLWDNGILTMVLNSTRYIKSWSTSDFYEAPQYAQMAPFQPLTTSGSANNALQDGMDADAGMVDVEPTIRFSGDSDNTIALNWPNAGASFGPVSNYAFETDNADDVYMSIAYVNIYMNGLLGQNLSFTGSRGVM